VKCEGTLPIMYMGPKVRAQPHTMKDVLKSNNTEVNTEGKRHWKENVDCCPKTVKNQQEGNTYHAERKDNYPRPKFFYLKVAMVKSSYSKDQCNHVAKRLVDGRDQQSQLSRGTNHEISYDPKLP
jgi:hypothetical protein